MIHHQLFKDFPNFVGTLFQIGLGTSEIGSGSPQENFPEHMGLPKLQSHFPRNSHLIEFQIGTDNNHGTPGVVHSLSEQILTEATLFFWHEDRESQPLIFPHTTTPTLYAFS